MAPRTALSVCVKREELTDILIYRSGGFNVVRLRSYPQAAPRRFACIQRDVQSGPGSSSHVKRITSLLYEKMILFVVWRSVVESRCYLYKAGKKLRQVDK